MMNILILSAFPEEQAHYFNTYPIKPYQRISNIAVSCYQSQNYILYFATTGMGTINASCVIATLTAHLNIDSIFFSGTSGGIDPELSINDTVIGTKIFDADLLTLHKNISNTNFKSALTNPNTQQLTPEIYTAPRSLLKIAVKIALGTNNVHQGIIATSNYFPAPKSLYQTIGQRQARIIDMESVAVYQFSWLTGIPSLVVRGISNCLNDEGDDKTQDGCDISGSSKNAASLIIKIIATIS